MRMIGLIILIFGLSGMECRYEILKGTSVRETHLESLAESAISTLLSCYEKKVNTVGGIGITEPTLVDILLTKQPLPLKLFREVDLKAEPDVRTVRPTPHNLQLFVVETSSRAQFKRNLWKAISSQYRTNSASFLIIDWPSRNNQKGCSKALDYLWGLWVFDVSNAIYVCVDKLEDRVLVYTYNPYTSKAPTPWKLNRTVHGIDDHPWSLFIREYHPGNREICNNLDFDKTRDLGGYKIRAFYYTDLPFSQITKEVATKISQSPGISETIAREALKDFNATLDLYIVGRNGNEHMAGNFIKNITSREIISHADIFMQIWSSVRTAGVKTSYPFMNYDYVVVTRHAGEKSQLDKLIGVFDKITRLSICLVVIATLIFFKFFLRQPLGTVIMNVVRIVGNTGLLIVPNGNAPRLYLAGVFILVVTIIGVYQGLLAALLTKPSPLPEINTLEDLANSPHKIHIVSGDFEKFFTDPRFDGRLVSLRRICRVDSNNNIIVRPLDACVGPRALLTLVAIDKNLHVSREAIVPAHAAFRIRRNWPLEDRLNEILASYYESYVFFHSYEDNIERKIKRAIHEEAVERDRPVAMTFSNLAFAFAFLGIGLSLATFVFVFEVVWERRQLRQRSIHKVSQTRANIKKIYVTDKKKKSVPA